MAPLDDSGEGVRPADGLSPWALADDARLRSVAARNLAAAADLERKALEMKRRVRASRQLIEQATRTVAATRRRRVQLAASLGSR